jgi:hypothetical protein
MTKINVTNIVDVDVDIPADMDTDMAVDMGADKYDDVAITTHFFMGHYQKWPT